MLISGGSIAGTNHTKPSSPGYNNNQDAFKFGIIDDNIAYGVVCDGCSSSKYSEVGAQIAVRILANLIEYKYLDFAEHDDFHDLVSSDFYKDMMDFVYSFCEENEKEIIMDYFLFTMVFFISFPEKTFICSIGDGVYVVNDKFVELTSPEKNKPPYFGYGLIDKKYLPPLQIVEIPTENINTLLIGSDGVNDLIKSENRIIPMTGEIVGNISQFFEILSKPDLIRRRLAVINHSIFKDGNFFPGLLPDDTTMVAWKK